MTKEQLLVEEIKAAIAAMSGPERLMVDSIADAMRHWVTRHPVTGSMALALVGAELAAK